MDLYIRVKRQQFLSGNKGRVVGLLIMVRGRILLNVNWEGKIL